MEGVDSFVRKKIFIEGVNNFVKKKLNNKYSFINLKFK